MSKDLYQPPSISVWRIYDPAVGKFCCSGRGLYANNGRSIWLSKSSVAIALKNMPHEIADRLIIKEFALVEKGT